MGAASDAAPQQRGATLSLQPSNHSSRAASVVLLLQELQPSYQIGVLAGNGNALDVPLQLSAQLQGRTLFLAILVACAAASLA